MWTAEERVALEPIVESVITALGRLTARRVLVLCSAEGDVALRIARHTREVVGLELAPDLLATSLARAADEPKLPVRFQQASIDRIPFPDEEYDALISEFIVYPTTTPTQIGQPEMARVLRHGGVMALTDVIVPEEPPEQVRAALAAVGLTYLCVATPGDFVGWMEGAGLVDIGMRHLTPLVRAVWERRLHGLHPAQAAELLLGEGRWALGKGVQYVGVSGRKP